MELQSTYSNADVIASEAKQSRDCFVAPWAPRNDNIIDLGVTHYPETLEFQRKLASEIALSNGNEAIIITEHFPVYTCGRSTKPHERPLNTMIPVIDIERGGGLTYHGPGQIVGYPILNLGKRKMSIPKYLRSLEELLISVLADYGVAARYREECRAGVWAGPEGAEKKLISMGIAVRRWVAFHGFALNVDCDLAPFKNAQPCGMAGDRVTSLKELGYDIPKEELKKHIIEKLEVSLRGA